MYIIGIPINVYKIWNDILSDKPPTDKNVLIKLLKSIKIQLVIMNSI